MNLDRLSVTLDKNWLICTGKLNQSETGCSRKNAFGINSYFCVQGQWNLSDVNFGSWLQVYPAGSFGIKTSLGLLLDPHETSAKQKAWVGSLLDPLLLHPTGVSSWDPQRKPTPKGNRSPCGAFLLFPSCFFFFSGAGTPKLAMLLVRPSHPPKGTIKRQTRPSWGQVP